MGIHTTNPDLGGEEEGESGRQAEGAPWSG